ncbi:oligonucleotide transporter [Histoplasma capsulatum var. duboisii H88]|uniref:Oligonucleotide transporter n=3 Tax=Ajellomyces capsulatus TaxID=5037 RepID=A0A8A1LBJ5_AJEC8|nr:oligonucleotide transporter [Histoplasma capsulatum var. duboisii H88]
MSGPALSDHEHPESHSSQSQSLGLRSSSYRSETHMEQDSNHEDADPTYHNQRDHGRFPHDSGADGLRSTRTSAQSFTARSLLMGLAIGTLITFSNTYFGLQTGWISTMAMPSSLIGFAAFKALSRHLSFPFTPIENVLIQTVAGAVGSMPLGCGFVGVIPSMEFLLRDGPDGERGADDGQGEGGPLKLPFGKLVVWSLGVCLFGVVFAVPLRKEVIIREKLKFPSGTATALMIRVLHGGGQTEEKGETVGITGEWRRRSRPDSGNEQERTTLLAREEREEASHSISRLAHAERDGRKDWKAKIKLLTYAFGISASYTLASYFIPQLRDLPIFGFSLASHWLWTLNLSPAYIGQGIIMGPSTSLHMLAGAILGWGILSPLAKHRGWAPGPVDSWEDGSKAWIVWVSLAIMLADSIINLGWLILRPFTTYGPLLLHTITRKDFWVGGFRPSRGRNSYTAILPLHDNDSDKEDAPPSELVSTSTVLILLPLTLVLNVICMHVSFGNLITPALAILATLLALLLSVMGVRALGETDLNPVSGISKLTQLIFALATPASSHTRRTAVVTNLLAGAVSEAGALQAGDMMQDLKTGHLLGASPKAQFYGQLIGSLFGAVASAAVYKLYITVYDVPGPMFQVPTAYVWIFTARLVTGQGLPEMAWQTATIAGVVFAVITVVRIMGAKHGKDGASAPWRPWIPGGIAVAVGMYNVPSFTLARAIGGVIVLWWGWVERRQQEQPRSQRWWSSGNGAVDDDDGDDTNALPSGIQRSSAVKSNDGKQRVGKGIGRDGDSDGGSTVVILASGLILGEGVVSIINLALASAGVPHL